MMGRSVTERTSHEAVGRVPEHRLPGGQGQGIVRLAQAIERIGYDEIAVFDHVVMGYPTDHEGRAPMYPPQMPILEAVVLLGVPRYRHRRVSLSTEVLVLPQRQPVARRQAGQLADTISGGRIRLGVGIGWQLAEYEALQGGLQHPGAGAWTRPWS